jgi:hypothetical protein
VRAAADRHNRQDPPKIRHIDHGIDAEID